MEKNLANWKELCDIVITEGSRSQGGNLRFAAAYAREGRMMTDGKAIAVQAMYILSNLGGWRGEHARVTKAGLKEYIL